MNANAPLEWIAIDWGTSNVRAWGLSRDGETTFATESDKGMSRLSKDDYPGVLRELVGDHIGAGSDPVDVVICGMAGAKQGWREAPYIETPADLRTLGQNAVMPDMPHDRLRPRILSGVCHKQAGAEDVMRGEETQVLGLMALKPDFSGTICMPGTHAKWVQVANGRITAFSTAMTGELYELLSTQTVLRHSLQGTLDGPSHEDGLKAGLKAGITHPENLTGQLFKVRAAALLADRDAAWCAGYLSGLLVGSEVAGHQSWIPDKPVPLVGSARLSRIYARAFDMMGASTETIDATTATLAGLAAARKQIP